MHCVLVRRNPALFSIMEEERVTDLPLPQSRMQVVAKYAVIHEHAFVVHHLAIEPRERRVHIRPKEEAVHVPAAAQPSASDGDRNRDDCRPSRATERAALMDASHDLKTPGSGKGCKKEESVGSVLPVVVVAAHDSLEAEQQDRTQPQRSA